MADRPMGYGLTAELKKKTAGEYNMDDDMAVRQWIEAVLGIKLDSSETMQNILKSGVILCQLANTIIGPTAVKKINEGSMAFKQMENIGNFLSAADAYGVAKSDLFQTVDLYEGQDMQAVLCSIMAFSRKASSNGYNGPRLGPNEATANNREFTDEQQAPGQVIGLQMGENKGGTQSGFSDLPRQIV